MPSKTVDRRSEPVPVPVPPESLVPVFAALGDATRMRLMVLLCAGRASSITHLAANTDISRQAVTRHLQVLSDAGWVKDLKMGRERLWQLDPARLAEARRTLEIIGQQWNAALKPLKVFAESDEP